ncbi:MAG: LamG-like jellyroll fold domain-containing protein [Candidatus Binatia bacterium]
MNRLWMIVTGACGLLAVLLVVKQFGGADSSVSPTPRGGAESLASASRTERDGWTAREDAQSGANADVAAGARRSASGAENPGRGGGFTGGGHGSAFTRSGVDRGARVMGDGLGSTLDSGSSASEPISAAASVAAAPVPAGGLGPSHDTREQTGSRETGNQQIVQKNDKSANAAPEDPNAPVLSLPFDKSTEPDKGNAPAVNENVTCGGVGEGCVFDTNSRFAIPDAGNLSGEEGSISFCLQPQWSGADPSNADLVDLHTPNAWENNLKIFKNGNGLRFLLWPNSGIETGVAAKIDAWQAGQWHPVTATFGSDPNTGANTVSLYVDGVLVGQQPYDGQFQIPQQPLYIGDNVPAGSPAARSSLMNFQAYNRVLGPDEAANLAAGCPQ